MNAQDMLRICSGYAQHVLKTCTRYAQDSTCSNRCLLTRGLQGTCVISAGLLLPWLVLLLQYIYGPFLSTLWLGQVWMPDEPKSTSSSARSQSLRWDDTPSSASAVLSQDDTQPASASGPQGPTDPKGAQQKGPPSWWDPPPRIHVDQRYKEQVCPLYCRCCNMCFQAAWWRPLLPHALCHADLSNHTACMCLYSCSMQHCHICAISHHVLLAGPPRSDWPVDLQCAKGCFNRCKSMRQQHGLYLVCCCKSWQFCNPPCQQPLLWAVKSV